MIFLVRQSFWPITEEVLWFLMSFKMKYSKLFVLNFSFRVHANIWINHYNLMVALLQLQLYHFMNYLLNFWACVLKCAFFQFIFRVRSYIYRLYWKSDGILVMMIFSMMFKKLFWSGFKWYCMFEITNQEFLWCASVIPIPTK